MKSAWIFSFLLALAVALAWRLPQLDRRPMHGDEANQAVRTGMLMDEGVYHYDPTDHHGPVLYFSALPFCRATTSSFSETTEWNFRMVPVTFSLLTLLLMTLLARGRGENSDSLYLNTGGLMMALLLTACSPAMTYFSRFFIQETMLLTFLVGMFLCGYRWSASGGRGARAAWAAGFGAFAGLAMASKETVVLSFAAIAVALFATFGWRGVWRKLHWSDLLWAAGAALFVFVLFFSSFFTYPKGVYDAVFSTASAYLHRATAVPEHQHPWSFYLNILFWFKYGRGAVWSEAAILFPALFAMAVSFFPRRFPVTRDWTLTTRFLSLYTLVLTVIYSAIPYKTPWCGLSFLHGYLILAGIGFGLFFRWISRGIPGERRVARYAASAILLLAALLLLGRECMQTHRACFKLPADPRNPYVYAHTGSDAMNLVENVRESTAKLQGLDTPIALAVPPSDTWPLPWYFRAYRQVGYWQRVNDIPASFKPEILIVSADQGDIAAQRFGSGKIACFYGIRPGVLLNLFIPETTLGNN